MREILVRMHKRKFRKRESETVTKKQQIGAPKPIKVHELKSWPNYFGDAMCGRRTFELRKNDRNYQVGDHIKLREWIPGNHPKRRNHDPEMPIDDSTGLYTGSYFWARISYVLEPVRFDPEFGLVVGYVALGIEKISGPGKETVSKHSNDVQTLEPSTQQVEVGHK